MMFFKKAGNKNQAESQNKLKQEAAMAALAYLKPDSIIGIGTGSTVNYLITALAEQPGLKNLAKTYVSSSNQTTALLKQYGFFTEELNQVDHLDIYIDGADEINPFNQMIKGGGGALTREKILATAADFFICIADQTKEVKILGQYPLPIEVIPMARSYVARELLKLGGQPLYREGVTTDNWNIILDVHGLDISKPIELETQLNQIPGVVTCGLFAQRRADLALIGTERGMIFRET